jgi:hypothetical protein
MVGCFRYCLVVCVVMQEFLYDFNAALVGKAGLVKAVSMMSPHLRGGTDSGSEKLDRSVMNSKQRRAQLLLRNLVSTQEVVRGGKLLDLQEQYQRTLFPVMAAQLTQWQGRLGSTSQRLIEQFRSRMSKQHKSHLPIAAAAAVSASGNTEQDKRGDKNRVASLFTSISDSVTSLLHDGFGSSAKDKQRVQPNKVCFVLHAHSTTGGVRSSARYGKADIAYETVNALNVVECK